MVQLKYRPDIDGLRSLAVLPVVLFHAGVAGFSGGFVGVDIFFVISGYLITSIIMREITEGSFTYLDFWARRARRILPASVAMMLMVFVVGWFVMAPDDYFELARSARAQAFFAGNHYFWAESGYFDGPSELKPLLHTWSLAVEEQFYLVFPILFLFLHRFVPTQKYKVLIGVFLLSLIGSAVAVHDYPSTVFYLLPGRAWELLIGSLVAIYGHRSIQSAWLSELLSAIGFTMILYSIIFFNSAMVFPGLSAVIPTLGTALLIWTNTHHQTATKRILSLPVLVGVGLISYSLYLWHWPIMVFFRYSSVDELATEEKLVLVIISILVGYLSWKYIETPFRTRKLFPADKRLLVVACVSLLTIAVIGQIIRRADGYPPRLPEQALRYAQAAEWTDEQEKCSDIGAQEIRKGAFCSAGTKNLAGHKIFFWGDSHAAALYPAVKAAALEANGFVLHAAKNGCAGLKGSLRKDYPECVEFNDAILGQIDVLDVDAVILASRWSVLVHGKHEEQGAERFRVMLGDDEKSPEKARIILKEYLLNTIQAFQSRGIQVWIVREVPFQGVDVPHELTKRALKSQEVSGLGVTTEQHHDRQKVINEIFRELESEGVKFLDPAPNLCFDGFCPAALGGRALYRDDDHLSVDGALSVREMLRPVFSQPR